jgi:CRP-like cAMP-binding protein
MLQRGKYMSAFDFEDKIISFSANKIKYQANEIIFLEGDICQQIAYVVSGEIIIRSITPDGSEFIIQDILPGQFFGDVMLFAKAKTYLGNVVAMKASTVIYFDMESFIRLLQSNAEFLANYLSMLADKTFHLKQNIKLLGLPTLRDKLLFYLEYESRSQNKKSIVLPMTRETLATMLNVRRPSLSRELSKMQKARLILVNNRVITLIK